GHGEAERGRPRQGARGAGDGEGDRARGGRGICRERQRARGRRGVGAEGRGDAAGQRGGGQGHTAGETVLRRDGDRAGAAAALGDGQATRRGREGIGRRGGHGEAERGGLRQGARSGGDGGGERARGGRGFWRERQRARGRRGVGAEGRGDAAGHRGDTLSLHDALPILRRDGDRAGAAAALGDGQAAGRGRQGIGRRGSHGEVERGGL